MLTAALYFHLLTVYTPITPDDLLGPCSPFFSWVLTLVSPLLLQQKQSFLTSCHAGTFLEYTRCLCPTLDISHLVKKKKEGAHGLVSSEHYFSTLTHDWEFVRAPNSRPEAIVPSRLSASCHHFTAENFDANWFLILLLMSLGMSWAWCAQSHFYALSMGFPSMPSLPC